MEDMVNSTAPAASPLSIELLQATYKGKKVLLTGHTGFKGAWLLYWLHLLGADVTGYALAPDSQPSLYELLAGDSLCHSIIGDLSDRAALEQAVAECQPDFVFHLAAQPLVRLSYDIPVETFATNALGTANLLDALRRLAKPCTIVAITTDKVYENKEWVYPYRENDRLGGYDPYSASKACAELVINCYAQSFFNSADYEHHQKSLAVGRAGNVIGGGDWAKDRIIPDIVRALASGQPVQVRNPQAVRPWQHVLEPLGGYLLLGARLAAEPTRYTGAWNFGPHLQDTLPVSALADTALHAWGAGHYETPALANQPHEAGLLKLDISKSVNELRWQPRYDAASSIRRTIAWYKALASGQLAAELVRSDIEAYSSLV
ncbi:CDP-glucose 4,6-dehydratase [Hymenobacter cheonanensis]|uniref:CDP-glucose 4,6-dehydratase n=1 Tax=Hymenobacter sp. CA2-7 TaxID=3063993 RepID=UPI0027129A1B|nr:CDP-glucose 4,6-dehydratase [Hymenobacter sp. CA2-7]MDO7884408.1 CDP-glucose 4,6-dehydratase [Hymenobacter sp. CA2-7]